MTDKHNPRDLIGERSRRGYLQHHGGTDNEVNARIIRYLLFITLLLFRGKPWPSKNIFPSLASLVREMICSPPVAKVYSKKSATKLNPQGSSSSILEINIGGLRYSTLY